MPKRKQKRKNNSDTAPCVREVLVKARMALDLERSKNARLRAEVAKLQALLAPPKAVA